jgi:single-stranded DNA-binding protein
MGRVFCPRRLHPVAAAARARCGPPLRHGAVPCPRSAGPSLVSLRWIRVLSRRHQQSHAGEKHESTSFRLAVPRPVGDGADFIDVVCFDKLAATCAEWLTKGRQVAVVGKLRLNEWTGREGERRSKVQVMADAVTFLGSPKKTGDPDGGVAEPADKPAVGAFRRNAG